MAMEPIFAAASAVHAGDEGRPARMVAGETLVVAAMVSVELPPRARNEASLKRDVADEVPW